MPKMSNEKCREGIHLQGGCERESETVHKSTASFRASNNDADGSRSNFSHVDILIVGGGPVGLTLALNLKNSGLNIVILEARRDQNNDEKVHQDASPTSATDSRTLALSHDSKTLLERLGVWGPQLEATPITTIHVSDRSNFGRCVLSAATLDIPALGYVLSYKKLHSALKKRLAETSVSFMDGAEVRQITSTASYGVAHFYREGQLREITAKLLVIADGGNTASTSDMERRDKDYEQTAVVAHIKSELPHDNVAYERFTSMGPAALLPYADKFALIWTGTPEHAKTLMQLPDNVFLAQLHHHFGDRVGKFLTVGKRASFPLSLKYTKTRVAQRRVFIGNASQILHPVAGQGFNLGLRDAWELGHAILQTESSMLGSDMMLQRYHKQRGSDTMASILFTDFLVGAFSNNNLLLRHARGLALTALDLLPMAKRSLMKKMIYGTRG